MITIPLKICPRIPTGIYNGRISNLSWSKAKSIVYGYWHDSPTQQLYSAKRSIQPYQKLLQACGSRAYNDPHVSIPSENIDNHDKILLNGVREMRRGPEGLYDLTIIIEEKRFHVHSVLVGAVSSGFRSLASRRPWKNLPEQVFNLDKGTLSSITPSTANLVAGTCAPSKWWSLVTFYRVRVTLTQPDYVELTTAQNYSHKLYPGSDMPKHISPIPILSGIMV
jgi:hypothetical protein